MMLPIKVSDPTWRVNNFSPESFEEGIRTNLDVVEEVCEITKIMSEAMKRRVEAKYKTRGFQGVLERRIWYYEKTILCR